MNEKRRKALREAIDELEEAKAKIESAKATVDFCKDEENDSYEGLPEGIQDGERGDAMQENIDNLEEAYGDIEDLPDNIYEAINLIQEAIDR